MPPRVYLAGPDVFLPEPRRRGDALRRICAAHGLDGVFPLDPLPGGPAAGTDPHAIARHNEAHIRRCDALIANLTPFRGPGADNGTAYEVGFARALGRPVFAWSTSEADYLQRCRALPGTALRDGTWCDAEGLEVEAFGLGDNLMISCAGPLVARTADRWGDLSVFEDCVSAAARVLLGSGA